MENETYVFPVSFAQERLWFLNLLEPDSPAYNVVRSFRVNGPLDTDCLHRVFQALIDRHETLRTTVTSMDNSPVQLVKQKGKIEIPVIDLSTLPQAEQESEMKRLAGEEFRRTFNLAEGPLLRVTVLKLTDTEHVLFLAISHIVSDGWSMGIIAQEMATLYEAFTAGKHSPLPELAIQYADFVQWQREYLQGEVLESQVAYWKQQLEGNLAVLELPMDYPRPPLQTYNGKRRFLRIDQRLTNELVALSRREGVTLFMTLLAAFQTLLHRYTGQEDIIVGSPIANRNQLEIEGIIGFFVNTLAMRTDFSGDPTFREILGRVKETALGAYGKQDLPFEKLVDELKVPRSLNYSPIVQVMFILQNTPLQPIPFSGMTLTPMEVDTGTSKFDMTLELAERDDGLNGWIEYNTDLFAPDTIERLVGHLQTLLTAISAQPEQRVSLLPLLTEDERRQIIVGWNDTKVKYPQDKPIHQIFEDRAAETPDSIALSFEGRQLTYRELNRRANQLAHYLQTMGVGPESLVGIAVERSLEMVIGLYGILKAGGAYVPLDPTYPAERIAYMMEDANVPVLLTQERLLDRLPRHNARVVCLDADWDELIGGQNAENPADRVGLDNLAYMIYTSGSTGNPKGAMNTHRAILNRLLWMQGAYRLTESDRVLQKTPFSFDVSVWEFFWPLMFGARLVIARPEGHRDSDYLVKTIIEEQITTMHFVPSMLQIFLMARGVENCTSLRQVVCSGEVLSLELQERFFERSGAELHNLYGPTEAAVDVSYWECLRESDIKTVPIGRPVANTSLYILDRNMQPVPVGVPGELYIGGVQVGRGYLNRPELTAEKFVPDPFSDDPGARLYRTGDLTRYLPDGNIEYLGRLDFQVKLRGNRIEMGEIEALLGQHPSLRDAVVMAREDVPDDKRLVAYVIAENHGNVSVAELRDYLMQKLPDYMIPSNFVVLDEFPLSPNGKTDRNRLPAPDISQFDSETAYVPPKNELQQTVARIWQEVLGVPRVGMNDNFFELGGHSLLIVQVYYKLSEIVEKELTITDMFRFPTINTLTEYLSGGADAGDEENLRKSVDRAEARRYAIKRRRQVHKRHT